MDITALMQRQRAYFASGATRPHAFRLAQLGKLEAALESRESLLLDALHADLRKSPFEAYATELGLVLAEIRYARRHLAGWMRRRRCAVPWLSWPGSGFVQPEPFGLALILGPWNYPLQLMLLPLVGAIAAGNCAVLKPSELAPQTAERIAEIIRATFAEEYLTVIPGEREVAEALLRERFDTIFFTGSTSIGRAVMAAAARHLTPVTLELGGKSPCIVCGDAPVERTARRIVWGKFLNAGQTCVAPDFLMVQDSIRDRLVEALKRTLTEFYGSDPQRSPDYGRIVNRRHFDRLTRYLADGSIVHGGQHDAADLYLAPTILVDPTPDAPVMQEEIFGPILPVRSYQRLDDALTFVGERPVPLALYLFTRDRAVQEQVLAGTRSGGICINDTVSQVVGPGLPFGGLGESGLGAYHGRASFDAFSHRRAVLRRSLSLDPSLRYPPPRVALATLRRAMRHLLGR